jgi:hypothetical protein
MFCIAIFQGRIESLYWPVDHIVEDYNFRPTPGHATNDSKCTYLLLQALVAAAVLVDKLLDFFSFLLCLPLVQIHGWGSLDTISSSSGSTDAWEQRITTHRLRLECRSTVLCRVESRQLRCINCHTICTILIHIDNTRASTQ